MASGQAETLNLEVATPLGLALKVSAESVQAPSVSGEFGVFPNHLPLLASLKSGLLKYKVGNTEYVAAIGPGFVEAGPAKVLVLTDRFVKPEDVDVAAAQKDRDEANAKLGNLTGDNAAADRKELQRDLEWAQALIDLAAVRAH